MLSPYLWFEAIPEMGGGSLTADLPRRYNVALPPCCSRMQHPNSNAPVTSVMCGRFAVSGSQVFVAPSYSHDRFGNVHCRYSWRLQWTPFCGCSIWSVRRSQVNSICPFWALFLLRKRKCWRTFWSLFFCDCFTHNETESPSPKDEFGVPGTFYSWNVGCLAVDAILADTKEHTHSFPLASASVFLGWIAGIQRVHICIQCSVRAS